MNNPFIYGTVVTGQNFTNRIKETNELIDDIKSGQNIFLFSPRRYGKTSLIKVIQNKLEKENFITIYIDFYRVYSKLRFIELYSRIIAKKIDTKLDSVINFFKNNIKNIVPSISFDNFGNPVFKIEFPRNKNNEDYILEEILQLPCKLAKKKSKKIVVIFDEFQEINNINGDSFEKELRASIQHHENISYIFMGSKTHILQNMFTNKNRALYKIGKIFPLKKIPAPELIKFILKKFKAGSYIINKKIAESICNITLNHPYYTQMLCHEVWEVSIDSKLVNNDSVQFAIDKILNNQSELYIKIWETLSLNQKALLNAFLRSGIRGIYSQKYIETNQLSSVSTIQRSVKSLIEKGVIEKYEDKYQFTDIFFKYWLEKNII